MLCRPGSGRGVPPRPQGGRCCRSGAPARARCSPRAPICTGIPEPLVDLLHLDDHAQGSARSGPDAAGGRPRASWSRPSGTRSASGTSCSDSFAAWGVTPRPGARPRACRSAASAHPLPLGVVPLAALVASSAVVLAPFRPSDAPRPRLPRWCADRPRPATLPRASRVVAEWRTGTLLLRCEGFMVVVRWREMA